MKIIKLDLRNRTPLNKVGFAQQVADGLTGNANVPTPVVTPAQLNTAATTLLDKHNKVAEAENLVTTRVGERDAAEAVLDALLEDLGEDVERKTGGNPAKIATVNMQVRDANAPVGDLAAPTSLAVTQGDGDGELDYHFNPVKGRQFYELQVKEEGTADWVTKVTDTKSSATAAGLTSGKKYRARVRAKGAAGYSPWSDEAGPKTAP